MSFNLYNLEFPTGVAVLGVIGRVKEDPGLSAANASDWIQAQGDSTQTQLFH